MQLTEALWRSIYNEAASAQSEKQRLLFFDFFTDLTYMPPMVTVAQVRSENAGVPSAGPVAARM